MHKYIKESLRGKIHFRPIALFGIVQFSVMWPIKHVHAMWLYWACWPVGVVQIKRLLTHNCGNRVIEQQSPDASTTLQLRFFSVADLVEMVR